MAYLVGVLVVVVLGAGLLGPSSDGSGGAMEKEIISGAIQHWYLLVGLFFMYRWFKAEKDERRAEEEARLKAAKKARKAEKKVVREIVRSELSDHIQAEMKELAKFRDDLQLEFKGIADLVRRHDLQIAHLEEKAK